jgi:hypothetical protein
MFSNLNLNRYHNLLKSVASLSKLYSESNIPFLHSRFIEKLFIETSLQKVMDLTRQDVSFDCLVDENIGVGIKTFRSEKNISHEKIAEFNNLSKSFEGLDFEKLSETVSIARNNRVISDAKEVEADLSKSYYHCLVRQVGAAFIHEEPLELIDLKKISIISGKKSKYPFFTDGKSEYSFNTSKSTLFKKFELNKHSNSKKINLPLILDSKVFDILNNFHKNLNPNVFQINKQESLNFFSTDLIQDDYIILPLYGQRTYKVVEKKSGINAWNACGRVRQFGESYIPIPSIVHKMKPNFFPSKDIKFKTKLPNNKIISTKICQEGNKAFQSDPLTDLCTWLYNIIDLDIEKPQFRFQQKNVYTYHDLEKVGKDSVKIIKVFNKEYDYEMHSMPLDSFEKFKNGKEEF